MLRGEICGSNGELEGAGLYTGERKLTIFGCRNDSVWRRRLAGEFDFRSCNGGSALIDYGAADDSCQSRSRVRSAWQLFAGGSFNFRWVRLTAIRWRVGWELLRLGVRGN